MLPPVLGQVIAWLGTIGLTGGTAVLAAWGVFRWLGKKWIDDHFTRELEAFRAQKQIELESFRRDYGRETERLKADLNRFADRATKFHAREYEVLPEAWGLMNKAHGITAGAVSYMQEYPDLNSMGARELDEWLQSAELNAYEEERLRAAGDKNRLYADLRFWKRVGEAEQAAVNFLNYVITQGVFLEEEMSARMMEVGVSLRRALIDRKMAERTKGFGYREDQPDFWARSVEEAERAKAQIDELKRDIRANLSRIQLAPDPPA